MYGFRGFVIGTAGAVIADLWVCEDDDLAGIGGIGEDFLIAGDRGIEDNFARAFGGRTKTPALEDGSVFQGQDCRIQQCPPGGGVIIIVPDTDAQRLSRREALRRGVQKDGSDGIDPQNLTARFSGSIPQDRGRASYRKLPLRLQETQLRLN